MKALFLTWALMGLWHGANWTFVFWGLYFATLIAVYWLSLPWFAGLPGWAARWGGWAVTLPAVMLGWIPFRSETLTATFAMYAKLFAPSAYGWRGLRENTYLVAALMLLAIIGAYAFRNAMLPRVGRFRAGWALAETGAFAVIIALVFVFLRPIKQFIYFQF
jgi:D-alanyl-lipoteichoic acid acyltransferase DltB (MBOAT superfamily)